MKRSLKTCVKAGTMLFLLACMLVIPCGTVRAEGQKATAEIKISHSFDAQNGYTPSAGTEYSYRISAADSTFPAPDGADDNGELTLQFDGLGTQSKTVSIPFTHAGIYQYTVEPVITNRYANYSYDETKYTVEINVQNENDELNPVVIIYKADDKDEKQEGIVYKNSYSMPSQSSGKHKHKSSSGTTTTSADSLLSQIDSIQGLLIPQTGDTNNIILWLIVVAIAGFGAILLLLYRSHLSQRE